MIPNYPEVPDRATHEGLIASVTGLADRVAALEEAEPEPPPTDPPDRILEDETISGFYVPAGETWELRGLVQTDANVIVDGKLRMRGGSTLRFINVNELAFVGGGMDPLSTDVGLWVMHEGELDVVGTPRAGWNRTGSDPSWLPGDELIMAPTARGDYDGFTSYTMGDPVPSVTLPAPWHSISAEVMNLTRDVVIEGTPGGRAHIFIRSDKPQVIRHARIRHMGPQQATGPGGDPEVVLGRYGLHFHHCMNGSRGTVVDGVVITDTGAHAFVPHVSHGITFLDCVAYNVQNDAYWWDRQDITHDVTYDGCLAARVWWPDHHPSITGFLLGRGSNTTIRNCCAVGILGGQNASCFHWTSKANQAPNVWNFSDNVGHNCDTHGVFTWQNTPTIHLVANSILYRNGDSGIDHGAYATPGYHYENLLLFENEKVGVQVHAGHGQKPPDRPDGYGLSWERITVIGSPVGFWLRSHNLPTFLPALFLECFTDAPTKVLWDDHSNNDRPGLYDFVDSGLAPTDVELGNTEEPPSLIRIQQTGADAWQIEPDGTVTEIPEFYTTET